MTNTHAADAGTKTSSQPRASLAPFRRRSRWQAFVDSRLLALEAALLLAFARLLVKHVPFRHWRRWLVSAEPNASLGRRGYRLPSVVHVARVVPRAAAMVPFKAVCLPQAMAGQWMLRWRGVPSRLSFGARREHEDSDGGEDSLGRRSGRHLTSRPISDAGEGGVGTAYHAWLCVGGQCVLGGPVDAYVRLPPFDAVPPRTRRHAASRTQSQRR